MSQNYRSPKPYPIPQGLGRNIRYARILQSVYSAGVSELTAIHQYVYHQMITRQEFPALSHALSEIAKVEMHHLNMLGSCILQLGLHPTFGYYQGTRKARWNSGFVRYARNPKGIVELSLEGEQQAIDGYNRALGAISNEQIMALLSRIIEDEQVHIEVLLQLSQA